jgi:nifR3 family TIM-barrel protein
MKLVLAPLAGFTDAPFRRMCHEGGADLVYTEMVSAAGLAHGSSPTRHLMEVMPGEGPVACQIFGSRENDIAFAAREIPAARFTELNLNAGCPMTKVTREGAGAKLVEDPRKIYRLLKAMTENTPLPVTLKTRVGPNPSRTNALEILDAAQQAGAKGIIVHARYTSQMHGGEVHYDLLSEIVAKSGIPVTGNGSVVDARSLSAMAATGVDAVMIGRAALGNPDIFRVLKGAEPSDGFIERHIGYLLDFREQLEREFPHDHIPSVDGYTSVKMHTHLFRYFSGRPGAAALRARLNSVRTFAEIYDIIRQYGTGRKSSG